MEESPRKGDHRSRRKSAIPRVRLVVLAVLLTLVLLVSITANLDLLLETKVVKYWANVEPNWTELEGEQELPLKRLPQAIIIGSRKSGTRALLKFLTANPRIRVASREVHFFDRMHNYQLGLDWYRDQMPLSLSHQVTIEKSPAYFVTKEAPERILSMNSSVKLVLVVRNPVIRLISDFSQLMAHKAQQELGASARDYDDYYHYILAGEEAGEHPMADGKQRQQQQQQQQQQEAFERYVRRPDGGINDQRRAVKASMYSDHLERWLARFGRHQLHVVDGERLISEPASELRQVESFLGLEPTITSEQFVFNQTKGFFCLLTPSPSSSESLNMDRRKRETDPGQKSSVFGEPPLCLGSDKGRRHVKVKPDLSNELQQFYRPFNEYLNSLVGREFNWTQAEIK